VAQEPLITKLGFDQDKPKQVAFGGIALDKLTRDLLDSQGRNLENCGYDPLTIVHLLNAPDLD
jgi:hypothetical protein